MTDGDFEALALPLLPRLLRYAQRLTGNEADAEDLVQSTYLNALKGWHSFVPGADVGRWLFTICRHTFFRARRHSADTIALETPELESLAGADQASAFIAAGADRWQDAPDVSEALDAAIRSLPETLRVLVMLVDVEGLSYEEAAQQEAVPIGTVRSRLYRARRLLQERLVRYAEDAGIIPGGTHV